MIKRKIEQLREWRRLSKFTPIVVIMRHADPYGGTGYDEEQALGELGWQQADRAADTILNQLGQDRPFVVYTTLPAP